MYTLLNLLRESFVPSSHVSDDVAYESSCSMFCKHLSLYDLPFLSLPVIRLINLTYQSFPFKQQCVSGVFRDTSDR